MEKYYTPDQVAEMLAVSAKTVRLWIKQKKLKGTKLSPRLWRIAESDLEKMIAAGRETDNADKKTVADTTETKANVAEKKVEKKGKKK